MRKVASKNQVERLVKALSDGATIEQASQAAGIKRSMAYRLANQYGFRHRWLPLSVINHKYLTMADRKVAKKGDAS